MRNKISYLLTKLVDIFFFLKFLFHYISTTCVGFGTVGLGQTESADWEEQNGRIFSNSHWQSE